MFAVGLSPFLIYSTQNTPEQSLETAFALHVVGSGVPRAQSQSHTPLTVFCSQGPKVFSCVSRELFWLLHSSIKCLVLFLTKMQHLF